MNPLELALIENHALARRGMGGGVGDLGSTLLTGALAIGTVAAAAVGAGILAGGFVATSRSTPSEFGVGLSAAVGAAMGAALVQGLALTRPT